MEVIVNHENISAPDHSTLQEVLSLSGIVQTKGIAVAVNNNIIPKTSWENHNIYQNDKITVIKAAQGG